MTLLLALLALAHLAAALYAHRRLADFVAGAGQARWLRGVLIGMGLAVGYAAMAYTAQPFVAALAFLSGYGAVHVPAAVILLLKRASGAGRS